jgi:hypothetical protein
MEQKKGQYYSIAVQQSGKSVEEIACMHAQG